MSLRVSPWVELARGLEYPEGPVYLSDGSVCVLEVKGGRMVRLRPDASATGGFRADAPISLQLAGLGNGPNGGALGPDGHLYICNNGGLGFTSIPLSENAESWTLNVPGLAAANYAGGFLQRLDLSSGAVELLCAGMRSPDDLVFDASGGLWFTDWGKLVAGAAGLSRDLTGVYYLPAGSRQPAQKIPQRSAPNGILLSPNGDRLYVAETYARWIVYWELDGPGQVRPNPKRLDGSHLLTAAIPGCGGLDSMAIDEQGNLYAVTILPEGQNPMSRGGITVVSPQGEILEFMAIEVGVPDPLPSNLCFGGPDRKTAFVTLGGTGRVVSCRMAIPGLSHAFEREAK